MNTGQRIRLIRKISENLAKYNDWSEIDLVLRQFHLRTSDEGAESMKKYVMAMIEYGDDEQLQELNSFLLEEFDISNTEKKLTNSVTECWKQAPLHVFISHSSLNKQEVVELKNFLLVYQISAFVAHEDIQPTEEWQDEILCALDTCHAVIAWSTPEFEGSAWAQQEIGVAIAKEKIIISVRRGIDPVGFTSRKQGVPGSASIPDIAKGIVGILTSKPRLEYFSQEAALQAFEHSRSFQDARYKIHILEKFNTWSVSQLQRLHGTLLHSQVSGSYGVPERVTALEKKFSLPQEEIIDFPF